MGDELLEKLRVEKRSAREFQKRKHPTWDENYELYRNKVRTNQLVQRQAVNIPLMKETIKTVLSKIDEAPVIDWEEQSGDEFKELIMQEKWDTWADKINLEGIDIQDKKTGLMYGRPHKKLNWENGDVTIDALDVYDVVIDPQVDPLDIETARFIVHQNIFRPLRDILADDRYTAKGKADLKRFMSEKQGMAVSGLNQQEWERKINRLQAMGVNSQDFATFGEGDTIVNLSEHITHLWEKGKFVRYVIVYADDEVELMKTPLKKAIGVESYPYSTWAEDIETQDYYVDSIADLVRVPNKVMNIWYSQMVENRTLGNFNMQYYAPVAGFEPKTHEPGPGRMIPSPPLGPGQSIRDVLQPVNVDKLDDSMDAMEYLTRIVERATSSTAIDKGVGEQGQQTLGEIEILLGKAMERTVAMSKFYRRSWKELAIKWYEMQKANASKGETLYKTDANGKVWPKKISPSDWKSEAGYDAIVRSSSEQEVEKTKTMQKLIFIKKLFPVNKAVDKIMQSRALEMVDVTPAELKGVEEEQEKINKEQMQQLQQQEQQPIEQQMGQEDQLLNQLEEQLNGLQ